MINKSKDADLDWDIPKEVKEVKDTMKIEFNVVVNELNVIFKRDDDEVFDYHDVLKPISVRETPEMPPVIIESLELITN